MLIVNVQSRYCVFFFKQKTAYEMRISDWSSDVCSSDLRSTDKTNGTADDIPTIRHQSFDSPKPQERRNNINTAIGRIGPPGSRSIDKQNGRASCRERVCQYV